MTSFFLAPFVIARRLPQLWFEALHPNPMVSEESRLAVTEKVAAFSQGMIAGHLSALSAPMTVSLALMTGRSPFAAVYEAQKAVAHAAIAPTTRQLKRNAARLSRPIRQRSRSTKA